MMTEYNYCVILAGGKGKRLWPCSRENKPKQFIDFFGLGQTLLQQTVQRMLKIMPQSHIFIATNQTYLKLIHEQLPNFPDNQILAEPIHRNTAPSVAWAAHRIMRYCPNANILVTPSDQTIVNEEAFLHDINKGFNFVATQDGFLTLGIKPTRPEPGYGYIQLGDEVEQDLYKVKSFTEKPEREFARMFVESGEFYWNTGIFMANITFMTQCLNKLLPDIFGNLDNLSDYKTIDEENQYVNQNFPLYSNLSVDYGVLEKSENVYVMKCTFGWADIGTWHGVYKWLQKSESDNVVIDSNVIMDESHGNIVKLSKGKLAIINGLDGYIIAEHDNVLLICKKEESSALIRKYVNEVQMKKGNEYI